MSSFAYNLTILAITMMPGTNEPISHSVVQQVQNESFCESALQAGVDEIKTASPGTEVLAWCAPSGNAVNQSQPRVGLNNGAGNNRFPDQ